MARTQRRQARERRTAIRDEVRRIAHMEHEGQRINKRLEEKLERQIEQELADWEARNRCDCIDQFCRACFCIDRWLRSRQPMPLSP